MLHFNHTDISNITKNWFLDFNEFMSKQNLNNEPDNYCSKLFHNESHWRDLIAITGDIITYSGVKKFVRILHKEVKNKGVKISNGF